MGAATLITDMIYSFESWVRQRDGLDNVTPEADKIVPMIAAAGASGMNRKQLGSAIKLDRDVLDQLLAGFLQTGLLTFAWENGVPVFRTQ